jgi:hypothetical protein
MGSTGGPVSVYLLLVNKIFINRKMIEMGLARADRTCSHRHYTKFLKAERKFSGEDYANVKSSAGIIGEVEPVRSAIFR